TASSRCRCSPPTSTGKPAAPAHGILGARCARLPCRPPALPPACPAARRPTGSAARRPIPLSPDGTRHPSPTRRATPADHLLRMGFAHATAAQEDTECARDQATKTPSPRLTRRRRRHPTPPPPAPPDQ